MRKKMGRLDILKSREIENHKGETFSYLKEDGTFLDSLLGYEINSDFKKALDVIVNQRRNCFISGSGGVGKSTFLEILMKILSEKYRKRSLNKVLVAPTGIASLRVGGMTIHKAFGFPIKPLGLDDVGGSKEGKDIAKVIDLLIIDEVSMVRSDIFVAIDIFLQRAKGNYSPFGGVQIVVVGDLFQLPPVVKSSEEGKFLFDHHGTKFFFNTQSFEDGNFVPIEFNTMYRQKDQELRDKLNLLRLGNIDKETLDFFNKRVVQEIDFCEKVGEDYVYLNSTNKDKDKINNEMLNSIDTEKYTFSLHCTGDIKPNDHPFEDPLVIKIGAQVMTVVNHIDGRYVNGTIGTVKKLVAYKDDEGKDHMAIVIDVDGREVRVCKHSMQKVKYRYNKEERKIEEEILGEISQYPIVLAWARTIHKSQSATFDKLYIDFGYKAFTEGMVYTALSRCKTYDNIGLKRPIKKEECMTDPEVINFYEKFFKTG